MVYLVPLLSLLKGVHKYPIWSIRSRFPDIRSVFLVFKILRVIDGSGISVFTYPKIPKRINFRFFFNILSEISSFKVGYPTIRSETYFRSLSFENFEFLVFGYPIRRFRIGLDHIFSNSKFRIGLNI